MKNRILSAYGTSLLGIASGLLTSFWLLREITKVVTPHDFGVYAFAMQICAYLPMLQLGVDFSATYHMARSLGGNERNEANSLFRALLRFNRVIFALVLLGVTVVTSALWYAPTLFTTGDPSVTRLAAQICLLAGAAQAVGFMARPYLAALTASNYQTIANLITVLRTIATAIVAYLLLEAGFHVFAVPVAEVITQPLAYFILRVVTDRRCTWRHRGYTQQSEERSKKSTSALMRYGAMTSLGGLAWTVESATDVMILAYFATPQLITIYVLWWRFPQMLFDLCTRLSFSAFPSFSRTLAVSEEHASILFGKVADVSLGLAALALAGIGIWLQPFVELWVGPQYIPQQSDHLAFLMGLLVFLRACGNLLGFFWLALGYARLSAALSWCQAGIKVGLAVWLVNTLGLAGLLIASCAAAALQIGVTASHLYKSGFLRFGTAVRFGILFAVASGASVFVSVSSSQVGWLEFMLGVLITTILWAVLWLGLAWTGDLRASIRSMLLPQIAS